MTSVKEIHSKIIGIQNTQKITKAMEMIALSKMRKMRKCMESSYPYKEKICQIINCLTLNNLEFKDHPYTKIRKVKCVGYFVIGTDRGLVGGLNVNLFRTLLMDIKKWNEQGVEVQLALFGAKTVSYFSSVGIKIIDQIVNTGDVLSTSRITNLVKIMIQSYEGCLLDRLYVVNNALVSTTVQKPRVFQILPFQSPKRTNIQAIPRDYLYEPDAKTLLDNLLVRYIKSQIYRSIIENQTSEQSARVVAMNIAIDNCVNLIQSLQLTQNKARQTKITQELTEIVSGFTTV